MLDFYAELNNVNAVVRVVPGDDQGHLDLEAIFSAQTGTVWKKFSYTNSYRKNYPGVGYTFNPNLGTPGEGCFIPPRPFASWNLDGTACSWSAPVPAPANSADYYWDEPSQSWVKK